MDVNLAGASQVGRLRVERGQPRAALDPEEFRARFHRATEEIIFLPQTRCTVRPKHEFATRNLIASRSELPLLSFDGLVAWYCREKLGGRHDLCDTSTRDAVDMIAYLLFG